MAAIFHPLLAMIASATDRELAKYIQFLKEENKILRSRLPGQVHTKPAERERLIKFGKALGRAVEELITIVSPSTFYRWLREENGQPKRKKNPKGGQRKPREIRELVLQIATVTNFGLTREVDPLIRTTQRGFLARIIHTLFLVVTGFSGGCREVFQGAGSPSPGFVLLCSP